MTYLSQLSIKVIILPTEDWTHLYMDTDSKKFGFINIKTPANIQKDANYNKNQQLKVIFSKKWEMLVFQFGMMKKI